MTSRFAGLKDAAAAKPAEAPRAPVSAPGSNKAKAREGKSIIAGYFSPELRKAVAQIALDEGVTVQALVGEGLDAVLRTRGRHPLGER